MLIILSFILHLRHASNLLQLDNGRKIPPSGWKCEKCDLDTNLWVNLTDGSVLCGRKFFDGSGGNDHAVEHYRETGNLHLLGKVIYNHWMICTVHCIKHQKINERNFALNL